MPNIFGTKNHCTKITINDIGSNVIYVFGGGLLVNTEDVFSKEELDKFEIDKTKVHMSKYFIYKTDSIGAIKSKLVLAINKFNKGSKIGENNIYLFVSKIIDVNIETIYRKETEDDSKKITHKQLLDITNNIVDFDENIIVKDEYSYEELKKYQIIPQPNKETIVPYKICSFDIEASSSHGDFPLPLKFSFKFDAAKNCSVKKAALRKRAYQVGNKLLYVIINNYTVYRYRACFTVYRYRACLNFDL